jgi:hypothetical protein
MKHFNTSIAGSVVGAIASIATTLTLLWAVVSLSEPQRSQLIGATAARQMVNQPDAALAKSGQTQLLPGLSKPVEFWSVAPPIADQCSSWIDAARASVGALTRSAACTRLHN